MIPTDRLQLLHLLVCVKCKYYNFVSVTSSPVSIQTQSLVLRALRKRKPQETHAPANRNARSKQWQPWLAACQRKRLRFLRFSFTQRKRLRLNGNRALCCERITGTWDYIRCVLRMVIGVLAPGCTQARAKGHKRATASQLPSCPIANLYDNFCWLNLLFSARVSYGKGQIGYPHTLLHGYTHGHRPRGRPRENGWTTSVKIVKT